MPPKKRIFAPKDQKTLFSFINHEKDSNNNNAHSHIDMEIGDESQDSVTDDATDMESTPTVNGMSVSATPHCRLWTYLFYPESDSHNKTQQT